VPDTGLDPLDDDVAGNISRASACTGEQFARTRSSTRFNEVELCEVCPYLM
jgi:hypothetical protein